MFVSHFILLVLLLLSLVLLTAQFDVKFDKDKYVVNEGNKVQVTIVTSGIAASQVIVVIEITGAGADAQFQGTSSTVIFTPGSHPNGSATVSFRAVDDNIPELNQTFPIKILSIAGLVQISNESAVVQINANDDFGGIFQIYKSQDPITLFERQSAGKLSIGNITVVRTKGAKTTEVISLVIGAINPSNTAVDREIVPVKRTMTFSPNVYSISELFQVLDDTEPELDESFFVTIGVVNGFGQIDSERNNKTLIIAANDSPIRFAQGQIEVTEGPGSKSISISILRGLDATGINKIGPTHETEKVEFQLNSISAQFGVDWSNVSLGSSVGTLGDNKTWGILTFLPGYTQQTLTVLILDDEEPEQDEELQVKLTLTEGSQAQLQTPSVFKIIIKGNDDQHGVLSVDVVNKFGTTDNTTDNGNNIPFVVVDEDADQYISSIKIIRSEGYFGEITVSWKLTSASGEVIGLSPTFGDVTLTNGEKDKFVQIAVQNNEKPEPKREIIFSLISVVGGARISDSSKCKIIIKDSDNAHGIVDLISQPISRITETADERYLDIGLSRTGAAIGAVTVTVLVTFTGKMSISDVLFDISDEQPLTVSIEANVGNVIIRKKLKHTFFLKSSDIFTVYLQNVSAEFGYYNTPKLGSTTQLSIKVTTKYADSLVFLNQVSHTRVAEPVSNIPSLLNIRINRDGTWKAVDVFWYINPVSTSLNLNDVSPFNSSIRFEKGEDVADVTIQILPDDVAEADEQFLFTLIPNKSDLNRMQIHPDKSAVQVTITENDDAAGQFSLQKLQANQSNILTEGGDALTIQIVRTGHSMVVRDVLVTSEPKDDQFYGIPKQLSFDIGVTMHQLSIIAKPDNIPEDNTQYSILLKDVPSNKFPANIQKQNYINVTVPKNDDPAGVIVFSGEQTHIFIDESTSSNFQSASFKVLRQRGTFYPVSVNYNVSGLNGSNAGDDFSSMAGTIVLAQGQSSAYLVLVAAADEIPERDETFMITLFNPTNGARLGNLTEVYVTIRQNDNPILFKEPNNLITTEGTPLKVHITRRWSTTSAALINVKTRSLTAKEGEDYEKLETGVAFAADETEKEVTVNIMEDNIAEPDEDFLLELLDPVGDISAYWNQSLRVIIAASDGAGGVVSFYDLAEAVLIEGKPTEIQIKRDKYAFTEVSVFWKIVEDSIKDQMEQTEGNATMKKGEYTTTILLTARNDSIPELNISGTIQIYHIAGAEVKMAAQQQMLTKSFVIVTNDDAHGRIERNRNDGDDSFTVLLFSEKQQQFYNSTLSNATGMAVNYSKYDSTAEVQLVRNGGLFDNIQVRWDIFPEILCGLPKFTDILMVSNRLNDILNSTTDGQRIMYHLEKAQSTTAVFDQMNEINKINTKRALVFSFCIGNDTDVTISVQSNMDKSIIILLFTAEVNCRIAGSTCSIKISYYNKHNKMQEDVFHQVDIPIFREWICTYVNVENRLAKIISYINGTEGISTTRILNGPGFSLSTTFLLTVTNKDADQTAILSNFLLFGQQLTENQVHHLHNKISPADWTKSTGVLTWMAGQSKPKEALNLEVIDDNLPEDDELFCLYLSSSSLARVPNFPIAKFQIIRSNYGNGLFSLDQNLCKMSLGNVTRGEGNENCLFECPIERQAGSFGDQTNVSWSLTSVTGIDIDMQFNQTNGTEIFVAGQRKKTITLTCVDDLVPEQNSIVMLRLIPPVQVSALVLNQHQVTFPPGSAAAVDPQHDRIHITLPQNDYPHGLCQLWLQNPADTFNLSSVDYVPMANKQETIYVSESVGSVTMYVVRTQGQNGTVYVEWRTRDVTTISSGINADYQPDGNLIEFKDGVISVPITIKIIPQNFPEDDETFIVELVNPQNGVQLDSPSLRSQLSVVILNSSDAYGVFGFDEEASQNITVEETNDSFVTFTIKRNFGLLRSVQINWTVVALQNETLSNEGGKGLDSLSVSSGTVNFEPDQSKAVILIKIIDDATPELSETFSVKLMESNLGRIDTSTDTTWFTIMANDDPYGVVGFSETSRLVYTNESRTQVKLQLVRSGGTFGNIRIYYRTDNEATSLFQYGNITVGWAQENWDYRVTNSYTTLHEGIGKVYLYIDILDDDLAELEEMFMVKLYRVELVESREIINMTAKSPRLESTFAAVTARVIIGRNDDPHGLVYLSDVSVQVFENQTTAFLKVHRTLGLFGKVTVETDVFQCF